MRATVLLGALRAAAEEWSRSQGYTPVVPHVIQASAGASSAVTFVLGYLPNPGSDFEGPTWDGHGETDAEALLALADVFLRSVRDTKRATMPHASHAINVAAGARELFAMELGAAMINGAVDSPTKGSE